MAETELTTIGREAAILQREAIRGRLEATSEVIAEGLITTDRQGRIVAVNQAAEMIFASTRDELTGVDLSTLLPARGACP